MAQPRQSTDEESAPLLDRDRRDEPQRDGFFAALTHPTRPLTNLEKILAIGAVILLILTSTFIGLFAGAEHTLKKERAGNHGGTAVTTTVTATKTGLYTTTISAVPTGKPEKPICVTPECVQLSAKIMSSLNTTVDPCDDFYEFSTGGWASTHSIPAEKGVFGSFNEVLDNNRKILIKVLESIPSKALDDSADSRNQQKLKAVYTSCMDVDALNDIGVKPFIPLADQVLEGFGPFDLVPAPDADLLDEASEWTGTYSELYELPEHLIAAAKKLAEAKAVKFASEYGKFTRDVPLAAELDEDFVLGDNNEERKDRITKTLAFLHTRGVQALINFDIEGDAGGEDSQVQALNVYQAFGGLPAKEYYEEKPVLEFYSSVVQNLLIEVASHTNAKNGSKKRDLSTEGIESWVEDIMEDSEGWPWPWPGGDKGGGGDGDGDKDKNPNTPPPIKEEPLEKRMERLAAKVVSFERELVRAGADPEYLFNPHYSYNPYNSSKVEKALPWMDLSNYLATYTTRTYPSKIIVTHPPYLKSISKLMDTTPDYVLSGYFITRLALEYASALGPKVGIRKEARRLSELLSGLQNGTEENRQDVCLGWVDRTVGFLAGREFVREAFSPEAKADGEGIINAIVKAFHDKLTNIPWMDNESAHAAQKKAEAIIPKVGYPTTPETQNPDSLAGWYRNVDINSNDFFGNVYKSTLAEIYRTWQTLGRKRDRGTWEMYPQTVNAYYSPPDGEIVFPAGILQPPFYELSWPSHLKYGAFGAVAAHELTHAFDNSGAQYDEKGRLRDWWTNGTVKAFEERAQCVAKQYSKYYVLDAEGKKVYVNGNLTNGEDIADSGLAQAFAAWKSSSKLQDELRLPGLDYSPEQLFFIAFGRIWSQLSRPAMAVVRVRTDPHSPNEWRVMGTLKNSKEFHEAFGCKSGTPMNPPKAQQCELW